MAANRHGTYPRDRLEKRERERIRRVQTLTRRSRASRCARRGKETFVWANRDRGWGPGSDKRKRAKLTKYSKQISRRSRSHSLNDTTTGDTRLAAGATLRTSIGYITHPHDSSLTCKYDSTSLFSVHTRFFCPQSRIDLLSCQSLCCLLCSCTLYSSPPRQIKYLRAPLPV